MRGLFDGIVPCIMLYTLCLYIRPGEWISFIYGGTIRHRSVCRNFFGRGADAG